MLLLADPDDTQVPVGTARRLAQTLPDARLQLVQGAGHHLPRRAPDEVADAIVAFLATVADMSADPVPASRRKDQVPNTRRAVDQLNVDHGVSGPGVVPSGPVRP